jgi:uncharacterized membrane protein YjgN (DUF898 family)
MIYGAFFLIGKHYAFGRLFNSIWNGSRLNDHQFRASLSAGTWVRLQFTNLLAIVGSCGLLYPWAVVRSTKYALSCLQLQPAAGLEKIARLGSARGSAIGDSAAEFAGFDFGL